MTNRGLFVNLEWGQVGDTHTRTFRCGVVAHVGGGQGGCAFSPASPGRPAGAWHVVGAQEVLAGGNEAASGVFMCLLSVFPSERWLPQSGAPAVWVTAQHRPWGSTYSVNIRGVTEPRPPKMGSGPRDTSLPDAGQGRTEPGPCQTFQMELGPRAAFQSLREEDPRGRAPPGHGGHAGVGLLLGWVLPARWVTDGWLIGPGSGFLSSLGGWEGEAGVM